MADDMEIFAVEDAHGDVVRVIEWAEVSEGIDPDATIGCIQFSDDDGDEDGPTVHLKAISALHLGTRLVAWAKRHGATAEAT